MLKHESEEMLKHEQQVLGCGGSLLLGSRRGHAQGRIWDFITQIDHNLTIGESKFHCILF